MSRICYGSSPLRQKQHDFAVEHQSVERWQDMLRRFAAETANKWQAALARWRRKRCR